MPELPEVENVRRSLAERIVGRAVAGVALHRADVVTGEATAAALLAGRRIATIDRLGKQLAVVAEARRGEEARCLCVHLGMTGSLCWRSAETPPDPRGHVHLSWTF